MNLFGVFGKRQLLSFTSACGAVFSWRWNIMDDLFYRKLSPNLPAEALCSLLLSPWPFRWYRLPRLLQYLRLDGCLCASRKQFLLKTPNLGILLLNGFLELLVFYFEQRYLAICFAEFISPPPPVFSPVRCGALRRLKPFLQPIQPCAQVVT